MMFHRNLALLFSLFMAAPLFAGPPNVSLKVLVNSDSQPGDKDATKETRTRWLTVRVTNTSNENLEGVSLKWTLYASELQKGANDIVVEKSGEETFKVEGKGRYTDITTAKVPFTKTLASKGKGKKKTPESGHSYYGYTVQILKDGAVMGEALSNEAMRKHLK
jgi:hypothetical protein